MHIFTKVDPKSGFCVIGFIDVDLTTAQTLYGATPPQSRFVPSRAYVLSKSVASLSNGANVALSERLATTVVPAVAASLQTNLAGANNDLTFTARTAGTAGNSITVAYLNPGTPSATLSVVDVGNAITVNLATGAGTAQVETATVGGASVGGGNVLVTVTGAGITGSPVLLTVAVAALDTAATVGGLIRAALSANGPITALYTIGGAGATASLTKTVAAANDATLNIGIDGTTNSTGVPDAASSANTTAGVAPTITSTAASIAAAIAADASASNLVSVANKSGNDGTGVVTALTATALASGAEAVGYTEGQSVVDAVDLADTDLNDKVQSLTLAHTKALKPESLLKLVITGATATTDLASIFVEGTATDL